jgi:hypothetical protein
MCSTIVQTRVLHQSGNESEGTLLSLRRLRKRGHLTRPLTCSTIVQIRVFH